MESLVSGMSKSRPLAVLLLWLLLGASFCSTIDATVAEGQVLLKLAGAWQNTTSSLSTWKSGRDPCGPPLWDYVACDNQSRVIKLNISNLGLSGTIPDDIGGLTNLQILDISNSGSSDFSTLAQNKFTGPLPASLFQLESLWSLNLSTIAGWGQPIPAEIAQLQNLEEFECSGSMVMGSIPAAFFALPKLRVLFLGDNSNLTCNLADFTSLGQLQILSLYGVNLSTAIPANFADKLPNLVYLNLHNCFLYGALPDNFGNLTALQHLELYGNTLSGYIPDTWRVLRNLYILRMSSNYVSGPFPSWFLELSNFSQLYFDTNFLWGEMPTLAALSKSQSVRLNCNYMNGTDPVLVYTNDNPYRTRYNCFTGASASDLRKVYDTSCDPHTLNCGDFYSQVVNRPSACIACPPNQFPQANNPVKNPCVCGITGGPKGSNGVPLRAVVGAVLGLFVVFAFIVAFILWKRRKQFAWLDKFRSTRKDLGDWDPPQGVQRFSLEELAKITDNFDESKVLGVGGFGKVFFGELGDGRMVAIKRASPNSVQGLGEFRNEVTLLSRLHHRHLVRLEGFCEEEGLEILVYEFMTNGNLHANLLGTVTSTPLHWYKRLDIAVAVAQGLEYLHYYADPPVIHRDVKPSNILLDDNMMAKLADFGISKATAEFDTHVSTRPAGTAGYLDPEYFLRRQLTTASDVYAYGVVLLELITGQEAIDHKRVEEFNLVEWVKKRFRTSGIVAIIDPQIDNSYPKEAYSVMTELALQCASFNKDERPNMKVILATLEPYLVEYAQYAVAPKPRNKSQRSHSTASAISMGSGSDTQGSVPTDPAYEAASVGLLRAVHPR